MRKKFKITCKPLCLQFQNDLNNILTCSYGVVFASFQSGHFEKKLHLRMFINMVSY